MKQFEFSAEIVEEINYQRYKHLAPLVQRRMDAIRLKAYGMLHKQIAEIIGITENTLRDYFELYAQGGIEKLKEIHYYQPESALKEHIVRMWKFVKKKCLYSKYYEKFPAFKAAISKCLDETLTTHKSDLDSLLTLHFQLFQKAQFVTV